MKAGSFNLNEYLERLTEAAEAKEEEAKEKAGKGAPTTKAAGGSGEGLIIPEENKKVFTWLKKEYQKGKTEVKVEMKMGGSKFTPGYDLQTDLKSVKDFKPGMFGDVKTSDSPGDKTEEGTDGGSVAAGSEKKPGKGPVDTAPDKNGKKEIPKKKTFNKDGGAGVKDAEVNEKDDDDEEVDKDGDKDKFKKEDKFKKKLKESVNEYGYPVNSEDGYPVNSEDGDFLNPKDGLVDFEIVQEGENLDREAYAYLSELPMTRKPNTSDLPYIKKIDVDPQLEAILSVVPVVNFSTYEALLSDWGESFPFTETFFIANVEEEDGVSFLVRPDGYDYARYIAELI